MGERLELLAPLAVANDQEADGGERGTDAHGGFKKHFVRFDRDETRHDADQRCAGLDA